MLRFVSILMHVSYGMNLLDLPVGLILLGLGVRH
jgi:hypothetical protein